MDRAPRSSRPVAGPGETAAGPGAGDPEEVVRAIESFQAGRHRDRAFRTLFETYHRPVQAYFSKRLAAADDCLDLTQETFLRVYKGLNGFRGDAPFGAWLFRIAWNVLQRRRSAGASAGGRRGGEVSWRQQEGEMERILARDSGQGQGDAEPALSGVLHRERQERLRRAIEELPPQRRKCMILWAYHELTYEQIAAVLRLSLGTVKAHLAQARQQLETRMSKAEERMDDGLH